MRPDTATSHTSVSTLPAERQQKLKSKLEQRVLQNYSTLHGPILGPASRALVQSELDVLLAKGKILDLDISRVAKRVLEAQLAEDEFRSKSSMEFEATQHQFPSRPNSSIQIRAGTPLLDKASLKLLNKMRQSGNLLPPTAPVKTTGALSKLAIGNTMNRTADEASPMKRDVQEESDILEITHPLDNSTQDLSLPLNDSANELGIEGAEDTQEDFERLEREKAQNAFRGKLGPVRTKKLNQRMANAAWEKKIAQDIQEFKTAAQNEKLENLSKKTDERKSLDVQVEIWKKVKAQQKALEDAYAAQEHEKRRNWEEERKNEEVRQSIQRVNDREMFQDQIKQKQRRQDSEERQRKKEEDDYAELIADEHRKRCDDDRRRKQKEAKDMKDFLAYNNELIAAKKRGKIEEIEEEKRYLKEYSEYLDKKEQEYKDGLSKIANKQKSHLQRATKTYFSSMWDLERRDAEKAAREQAELQQQLLQDDRKRRERIREENRKMQETLNRQVDEKNQQKRDEDNEKLRLRHRMDDEIREMHEAAHQQKMDNVVERARRMKELDEQVKEATLRAQNPLRLKIMGVN